MKIDREQYARELRRGPIEAIRWARHQGYRRMLTGSGWWIVTPDGRDVPVRAGTREPRARRNRGVRRAPWTRHRIHQVPLGRVGQDGQVKGTMNLPMKQRCDELIALHGSVRKALESRRECVARRCREGKQSPAAVEDIKALLELEKPTLEYRRELSDQVEVARCGNFEVKIVAMANRTFIVLLDGRELPDRLTFDSSFEAKLAAERQVLNVAKLAYDMLMR